MLSETEIHKAGRVDQIVRDYFDANPSISEIQAKELMDLFIEKGIFAKNHRNGLPIRKFLRALDAANKLELISNSKVIRKEVNRNWVFTRKGDVQQNPRLLDEICANGKLEEFRDTIKEILDEIHQRGCKVSTQYVRPTSSFEWYTPHPPMIRVKMHLNDQPLHIVWALLHEYGHFLSGKRQASDEKMGRENLAWKHADKLVSQFPQLSKHNASYSKYRKTCLKTYEEGLQLNKGEKK